MWIGLDIGGANLKSSDGEACSRTDPFAVWRQPEQLTDRLRSLIAQHPGCHGLSVTMTAELADCFATKADGVQAILDAVAAAADGREIAVWQTGGEFLTIDEAREFPPLVAAANWHALATWAGRLTGSGAGLLMDIGSTTTDIIPLCDGVPCPAGATDVERLTSGELVYVGVRRTPLCAVAEAVTLRGRRCPLAAELFAATLDLFLLRGEIPADPTCCDTADGRPATLAGAHARIAHLVCCDATEVTREEATTVANELREAVVCRLRGALQRVQQRLPAPCETLLLSGSGEFLARQLADSLPQLRTSARLSLTQSLGSEHSAAACAYALARLARERCDA